MELKVQEASRKKKKKSRNKLYKGTENQQSSDSRSYMNFVTGKIELWWEPVWKEIRSSLLINYQSFSCGENLKSGSSKQKFIHTTSSLLSPALREILSDRLEGVLLPFPSLDHWVRKHCLHLSYNQKKQLLEVCPNTKMHPSRKDCESQSPDSTAAVHLELCPQRTLLSLVSSRQEQEAPTHKQEGIIKQQRLQRAVLAKRHSQALLQP